MIPALTTAATPVPIAIFRTDLCSNAVKEIKERAAKIEHGRGFAVVAAAINNLASETKDAVDKIQETISAVQDAFASLDNDSRELLQFVQETVTPDYDNFIDIGWYIKESMKEVNEAVGSIAESAADSAGSSADVTDTVNEVSQMVSEVSDMTRDQKDVSDMLSDIVSRFKIS